MRVALKYCGSCNPEVDLSRIGSQVTELARQWGWEVIGLRQGQKAEVLVLLCGCPRTCVDREEVRSQAQRRILVAGRRVGWQPIDEAELPAAIIGAIEELAPEQAE